MTMAEDVFATRPIFYSGTINDPADPLARGACGPRRCYDALDFIDVVIASDGTPWSALTDNCISVCAGPGGLIQPTGIIGRLVGRAQAPLAGSHRFFHQRPDVKGLGDHHDGAMTAAHFQGRERGPVAAAVRVAAMSEVVRTRIEPAPSGSIHVATHGAVQLALRPPPRRRVCLEDRRHRRRWRHRRELSSRVGRYAVARPRVGRRPRGGRTTRPLSPEREGRPLRRRRRQAPRLACGLPVLLHR